ncbi:MAG: branched-chain amino acid ABC transporter permease [Rhizobiales bacterium]|jgi:branched-chain amino acid transport system permease protein|nr:branched-chain amino acid ABC transporter permease [Hyphomicrobiales bacterium]
MSDLLQFLFSGLTRGSIYGLVGIGFALIYRSSHVINFAQGEFVMIGGMVTVFLLAAGVPLPVAALGAILAAALIGVVAQVAIISRMRRPSTLSIIIVTVGISMFLRGAAEALLGRQFFSMKGFSGDDALVLLGAKVSPQSIWIFVSLVVTTAAISLFFRRTILGKGIQATSSNRLAAHLVGIDVPAVLAICFALSAALGALAGLLTTPITLTQYDVGITLGMKGFCAAILGGLANPFGAILGGLILGFAEALAGGYVSSAYQDAVAFILIIAMLLVRPNGLFSAPTVDRV